MVFSFSYLFRVLFLILLIILVILGWMANILFVKYIIILVYVSGVVVFILYISCMCWQVNSDYYLFIFFFSIFIIIFLDNGLIMKFIDVGEFFWIYLFFGFLFNILVRIYSLNLFKISGSLRF